MNKPHWPLALILSAVATTAAPHERWKQDRRVLACSPHKLHAGEALRLTLGPGHGQELSIRRASDRTTFVLIVGSPPREVYQLMTTTEFRHAKSVHIPSTLRATPWTAEAKADELVFSTSGQYHVFVSENLESERGGHTCQLKFIAR